MKKLGNIKYSLRRYDYLDGNFTQVCNDAFRLTNGNEFKIYSYLCYLYNKELGYSFPSLSNIAKNTNMTVKTVQKCIKRLEEIGLIKVGKFESKTSRYTNNIYKIFIPIIVKDEIEEQEREEVKKMLDKMVEDTEGKIYTLTFENEGEDDKKE